MFKRDPFLAALPAFVQGVARGGDESVSPDGLDATAFIADLLIAVRDLTCSVDMLRAQLVEDARIRGSKRATILEPIASPGAPHG